MDCDLMADDANAARDFLIDLWPYARPARFLSSKVDSLFLFFTRVSDFGLSINNPLVFCHVVIPSICFQSLFGRNSTVRLLPEPSDGCHAGCRPPTADDSQHIWSSRCCDRWQECSGRILV